MSVSAEDGDLYVPTYPVCFVTVSFSEPERKPGIKGMPTRTVLETTKISEWRMIGAEGADYTRDFPVERMMRDAEITQSYEGTKQIRRAVMAHQLLGERA
jgi:alkylation response protein AidB-like acyl-CoA dehydrogenase